MTQARYFRVLFSSCFAAMLLMFAGCWGSKFTLVNPEAARVDRAYLGNWSAVNSKGEASSLIIRNIDDKMFYVETKDGAKQYPEGISRYVGFLAPVKGATFAHLKNIQDDGNVQEEWMLMKMELNGDKLIVRQLKEDYMKEKNITSAEQLRKVVEQGIDDGAMYEKGEVITATRLAAN